MTLINGEIITLENGDTVKVSLEILSKKVTELIQNKKYKLKYTDNICDVQGPTGYIDYSLKPVFNLTFIFVGKINIELVERYIFYNISHGYYAMFSTADLDFVVKEII